jgi:hypothetical protein
MQLTTSGRKQLVDEFLFGYFGSCFLCAAAQLVVALCLFLFALMVRYPVLDDGLAGNASRPFQAQT